MEPWAITHLEWKKYRWPTTPTGKTFHYLQGDHIQLNMVVSRSTNSCLHRVSQFCCCQFMLSKRFLKDETSENNKPWSILLSLVGEHVKAPWFDAPTNFCRYHVYFRVLKKHSKCQKKGKRGKLFSYFSVYSHSSLSFLTTWTCFCGSLRNRYIFFQGFFHIIKLLSNAHVDRMFMQRLEFVVKLLSASNSLAVLELPTLKPTEASD